MTVSSQTSEQSFPGPSAATTYPLTFRFFSNSDIQAFLVDDATGLITDLMYGVDYTLAGAALPEVGGNAQSVLTKPTGIPAGSTMWVQRVMAIEQQTDITNQGDFYPEIHENVFDRLTMLIQQGFSGVDRALKRPLGLEYFDAESRRIANLLDPVNQQDATTMYWVQQYIAGILQTGQGPINNAANIVFVDGDGLATTVQNGVLKQFGSVNSVRARAGAKNGEQALLLGYFAGSPGIGGGLLYWDATSTLADDGGTVFAVTGVTTGRWRRKMVNNTVYVEWFGIIGDGVTLEDAKLRAAVAATPAGGTIIFPERKMTVLVDIPAGQSSRWQDAVTFNKPDMTVIGSHSCVFKLKDFCSAWTADVGVTALNVFRVSASRVTVRGLNVDANADHHYEVDGSGFKWWEEGPTGAMTRRPANAIAVCIEDNADMITDVLIEDNVSDRPLAGVYVAGNISFAPGTSLNDPNVYNGVLKTNVLERITVRGNRSSNCRGNDFVFIAGVRNSCGENNVSINSMYHQGRIYAGVVGTTMRNNRAYMSYTDIATRWTPSGLGYWRTDKPGDQYSKIIRCGYTIGSSSANTANNGGNILRCAAEGNEIVFDSNTADGGVADLTSASMHCHWAWYAANGIHITGNRAFNSPHRGIAAVLSILTATPEFHGVVLSNNIVENCRREAIYSLGTGAAFTENNIVNCGDGASGIPVVFLQGASRIYKNNLVWDRIGETHAGIIMQAVAYGPTGLAFVSDNMIHGYTGTRMSKDPSLVIHGTDGGGVLLTLASGWAAGPDATAPARVTINCAGQVTCDAQINSAAGGTDVFATLPVIYRPAQTKRQGMWNSTNTIQAASVSTAGALTMARGALAAGTTFYFNMTWPTDYRI